MSIVQVLVLALIQGLTEYLPVSSSAHLILGSVLFGWRDQGLVFDVATHLGTLLAVLIYFRSELMAMVMCWTHAPVTSEDRQHRSLAVFIALASIPALAAGWFMRDFVELYLRDVRIIAWATIGFGLLLWVADHYGKKQTSLETLSIRQALLIGLAQALALVPGTSRSGITITAGRLLGLDADSAARFSFLLAIPVIGAAGGYGALKVAMGDTAIDWTIFFLAVTLSALAGWACIAAFLALLQRVGLLPFVLYRLALGLLLLWLIL